METTRPTVRVRAAEAADSAAMLELIDALARYEKLDPPDASAKERLIEDAFGPCPRFQVFLAEAEHSASQPTVVGYAFVLETYSTFLAMPTLYLEDLFVLPEYRGIGAGFALFREVVAEATRRGCGRVDFVVLDWNQTARDFYARLGARHLDDWCYYRLTSDRFTGILATRE